LSSVREVDLSKITREIARLCGEADLDLPQDVMQAFIEGREREESPVGKEVFSRLMENAELAKNERMPICQDCGLAIVFVDLGQDVHLVGGDLNEAINQGVRQGYEEHYLRKSTCHPFTRANMGDNTPAVIHTRVVPGDKVHIFVVPKGGGSENMSRVHLLVPAQGLEGVKQKVIEAVEYAGPNPCPPIFVSLAVGGTFDDAAVRAKRSLLRKVGSINPDPEASALEDELHQMINNTGIGPAGLGGRMTCLDVFVDIKPCHIASLPVAINIQCHAARHKEVIL
jgi:fumarate hydratase subunit alpha